MPRTGTGQGGTDVVAWWREAVALSVMESRCKKATAFNAKLDYEFHSDGPFLLPGVSVQPKSALRSGIDS